MTLYFSPGFKDNALVILPFQQQTFCSFIEFKPRMDFLYTFFLYVLSSKLKRVLFNERIAIYFLIHTKLV